MPKFTVIVTRDTTESCEIEVEAESQEAAEQAGLQTALDFPGEQEWLPDDTTNASKDPYVTGCEEAALPPAYQYTSDRCQTQHWNEGNDVCADCGANLQ